MGRRIGSGSHPTVIRVSNSYRTSLLTFSPIYVAERDALNSVQMVASVPTLTADSDLPKVNNDGCGESVLIWGYASLWLGLVFFIMSNSGGVEQSYALPLFYFRLAPIGTAIHLDRCSGVGRHNPVASHGSAMVCFIFSRDIWRVLCSTEVGCVSRDGVSVCKQGNWVDAALALL